MTSEDWQEVSAVLSDNDKVGRDVRTEDWTVLVRVTVKRVSEAGGRLGSVAEAGGRTETDTDLQPPVSPLCSSCDLAVTLSDKVSSQN